MWFLLIITVVASAVCQSYVAQARKEGGLGANNCSVVSVATSISVLMGLMLYVIASFGIEMYEINDLDFFDYGEITTQGIMYIGAKLVGAVTVAESIINMLVCMAVGITEKRNAVS